MNDFAASCRVSNTHSASVLGRSAALARDPRGLKAAPTGVFPALATRLETRNTYWETV